MASPAARRTAWLTLVTFGCLLGGPLVRPAQAQVGQARSAYLVPFTSQGNVPEEIAQRVTSELAIALKEHRLDPRVQLPLELINLSDRDPIIRQALDDGSISEDDLANPPADKDTALDFAARIGLTSVLVGSIDAYTEAADRASAAVDVTVFEYQIPAGGAEPSIVRTVSKTISQRALNDRGKALLRTDLTERAAMSIAAVLLEAPQLAPPEQVDEQAKPASKGAGSALWIAIGVVAAVAAIFLISSVNGSKSKTNTGLGVSNVRAVSEADSVRVTWTASGSATGYNVYRRAVGNQPIRLRSRQSSSYTVLLNPETATTPTVQGGGRTSFIDTTADSGIIYEYAVAGVGSGGDVGPLSASSTAAQSGANIGVAPALTASSGNGFVSLSWTASSEFVDGYIIFRLQGAGAPNTGVNSPDQLARVGNVLSYDDASVTNGVSYTYVVQPISSVNVNQLLTGADSNAITVQASSGALPQAVRNVAVTVDSSARVRLTWTANPEPNVDFYEILRRTDRSRRVTTSGRSPWLRGLDNSGRAYVSRGDRRTGRQVDLTGYQLVGTSDSTITSFSEGPLPDGTYTYAVRAVDNAGQRGPATASDSVVVNAALAAPAGLRAVGLDSIVRLTWQPVAGDVQAYNVYRSQTAIGPTQLGPSTAPGIARVATVGGNVTTYDDSSLSNNVQFYYVVTSVDSQGAESDFGKGDSPDTGVVGIPHPAPANMDFTVDKQNLSANGVSTTGCTVTITDANNNPTAGVRVDLTTDHGKFVNLPSTATTLDTDGRQVRGLTDLSGQIKLDLQSEALTTPGAQVSVNVQARAAELPDNVELQSRTISFLASVPNVIVLNTGDAQLVADNASTTTVTARVLDALGQAVPDGNFAVEFGLLSNNGAIRRAGNVQDYPFTDGPVTVVVPVVGGQAQAVYRSGSDASTLGSQNVVALSATVQNSPAVTARTLVTLIPGTAARVQFQVDGATINQLTLATAGNADLTVLVEDAQHNPVRSGVNATFSLQPTGVVTAAGTGTTDADGVISLPVTAGPNAGGAVLTVTIPGTQVQSQLAIIVQ